MITDNDRRKNAKKWIRALRSGKYKQGKFSLHTKKDRFCCLGVACKIFEKELKVSENSENYLYDKHGSSLPKKMINKLGLVGSFGKSKSCKSTLADLNDMEGYSLKKIADHLEENWDDYFKMPKNAPRKKKVDKS